MGRPADAVAAVAHHTAHQMFRLTAPHPEAPGPRHRRHLTEAVRARLAADVPVASYLSGGIDSAMLGLGKASLADLGPGDIIVPDRFSDRVGQAVVLQVPVGRRNALVIPRRFVATRFGIDVDQAARRLTVLGVSNGGADKR